jgi:hypothetical protein
LAELRPESRTRCERGVLRMERSSALPSPRDEGEDGRH